ncbi:MAG TPA: type II toxin-antitoxin system VapC family toxin [Polyangiaceae bacterium]|nr:type II toxin-antitoxin system VapC family toxin [Polyangiaceae bacterium]
MILPDINLLLYATISTFEQHGAATKWFSSVLNGEEQVLLPAVSVFGFIRIASNPRIFESPIPVEDAVSSVETWLDRPNVHFLSPGPRFLEIAFRLLRDLGTARNLTTDVQLAALAMENQATLYSHDTDFAKFDGLRWVDPLE